MKAEGDGFDVRSLAVTYRGGLNLGRHKHRWGQLVYASAGVMRVSTDARAWTVTPTRAIWIPAGIDHAIAGRGEVSLRTLYIAPSRAAPLPRDAGVLEITPLLRELILHILGAGMLAPEWAEQDRLAGVLIDQLLTANVVDLSLPLPTDMRARRLADCILTAPGDRSHLSALASESGASLRTLQRLFSEQTGLTLEAWRQKCRLIEAAACLSVGDRVTDVAEKCGYESLAAFISAFSRVFGMTPGRFGRAARS